jgi:DNA helicase II / ATP-dependent DNA helicase PcrA
LQVQLYALAAKEILSESAKTGSVHLLKDSQRIEIPIDDTALDAALKNVEWAVRGIIARDYPMRPGQEKCEGCDFKRICPKRREAFDTGTLPPAIRTPVGDRMAEAF